MILAAGLGTRLKPFTDHHPKALALVNGKSLLQRNIEYLQQYGIKEVIATPTPTLVLSQLMQEFNGEIPELNVKRPTLEEIYLRMIGDAS